MIAKPTERRRFLAAAVNSIHGVIGGTLGVLLGGAVIGPSFLRRRETWLKAGSLDALTEDEPTPVTLRVSKQDGFTQSVERYVVFLVKSGERVTALSSTCTHLGAVLAGIPRQSSSNVPVMAASTIEQALLLQALLPRHSRRSPRALTATRCSSRHNQAA